MCISSCRDRSLRQRRRRPNTRGVSSVLFSVVFGHLPIWGFVCVWERGMSRKNLGGIRKEEDHQTVAFFWQGTRIKGKRIRQALSLICVSCFAMQVQSSHLSCWDVLGWNRLDLKRAMSGVEGVSWTIVSRLVYSICCWRGMYIIAFCGCCMLYATLKKNGSLHAWMSLAYSIVF